MTRTEKIFKKNIIRLRESRGLTRYKVASLLNMNRPYYYNMENMEKKQSPTYETLEKIAVFYKVEVYELFMEEKNNE